jgi:ABC-type lipoprotein release transport system permease subunit
MRIYLYESSVLIITSILVGTFIGIVISTTLILQFNIFTEIPFEFTFPANFYVVMCVTGFILGLLGSYYPTKEVNKHSLVKIMKGNYE